MITRRAHRVVRHVLSSDPALDKSNGFEGHWAKFLETGDPSVLPLVDGRKPTVFHLSGLKRQHVLELGDLSDPETLMRRHDSIVSFGLVEVSNFVDEAGRPLALEFDDWRGGKRVSEKSMDDLYAAEFIDIILELGTRILQVSRPGPT